MHAHRALRLLLSAVFFVLFFALVHVNLGFRPEAVAAVSAALMKP